MYLTPCHLIHGCSSAFALHVLSECAIKRKLPSSFYSVAEACLPRFTILIDAAVTIKCFCVACSYLIVVGDTMPAVCIRSAFSDFIGPLTTANRRWWMITVVFLVSAFMVASVVEKLGVVLALVGATGSTTVSYILPGFCYYYTFPPHDLDGRPLWKTYTALVQGCVGIAIIPFCLFFIFE